MLNKLAKPTYAIIKGDELFHSNFHSKFTVKDMVKDMKNNNPRLLPQYTKLD
jgi:hypothetical protein